MGKPSTLITGSAGQLGQALAHLYSDAQFKDRRSLDITNLEEVTSFRWNNINTIVNAAAYTKVDEAETPSGKLAAWATNSEGPKNLANIASKLDKTLIHVSTDYVFDGTQLGAYSEQDPVNPQSEYGKSKAAGDKAVSKISKNYILRTSWVIGEGNNFVRTMLKLGKDKTELSIVNDQVGRPSFTTDLAKAILYLDKTRPDYGLYNFSNSGEPVSWAEFARTIFDMAGISCRVKNVSTKEYFASKTVWAPRPANSVLDTSKIQATGLKIPSWLDSLKQYIKAQA